MSDRYFKSERFECQCSSFQHNVRFSVDDDGSVYLDVGLNAHLRWWERVARALRYVFAPGTSRYGFYDEVIFRDEDRTKLIALLSNPPTHM